MSLSLDFGRRIKAKSVILQQRAHTYPGMVVTAQKASKDIHGTQAYWREKS